jgi:hypothetical protein
MTARNSARRQPATAKRAVLLERFDGVGRAAWIITARGRQQRAENDLVPSNEKDEHRTHTAYTADSSIMIRTSERSASNVAAYASRRARMTMSRGALPCSAGSSSRRASSLRRRLSLFRSTAECWWRGTTTPMRETPRGEARTRTSRCTVRIRFPSRMAA